MGWLAIVDKALIGSNDLDAELADTEEDDEGAGSNGLLASLLALLGWGCTLAIFF